MKRCWWMIFPWTLLAQPTVAPTPENVGHSRGDSFSGYNIRQSFELGYRFAGIEGNREKYRSDVNFRNGLRLLQTSLSIHSRDGKGRYFDEFLVNAQGLGNDPYQFANLRLEKNRRFRYEMNWRLNDYFNPGLTLAYGQHLQNLQRRMQDHQLTLFPQSRFQFYGGFSRNVQNGPALSTANLFDARGNLFPFFEQIRREQTEYRLGGQVQAAGMKLFWQRGWEIFKEDSTGLLTTPGIPLDPTVTNTTLSRLRRDEPYHGITPHWRVNLFTEKGKWFAVNGRFTHSAGARHFLYDDFGAGTLRGTTRNVQTLVYGNARRPITSANGSLSLFPTASLSITNSTAYNQTKMDGDNKIRQFTNNSLDSTLLNFQFLGIRMVTNSTVLDYAIRPWLSVQGGYQFSERRVRSTETVGDLNLLDAIKGEQTNRLHAVTAGFRLRPRKGLTIVADGELGRQDHPFAPTSEKDYHAFGARIEYKRKLFRLATQARTNLNFNSASLFHASSRSRNYSADASWTPNTRLAVDFGYQKLHLDTLSGLAYFRDSVLVTGDRSYYVSNLHASHAGVRLALLKKVDLYGGYALTKDRGGRAREEYTMLPALIAAQSFPLTFVSPQMRLSVQLREKWRWNLGYQYYNYAEKVLSQQDYRAHTAYASVLWSF
ncbi:hypothetical protein [Bryobacter aggregatus]|uniref:hypothetical protein n=1 Tax=Bryobacter aggregatus TaxID=360054 RepID=UPI0012BAEAF8|nr:hypothetical protein [Bryobacter aggregatus]